MFVSDFSADHGVLAVEAASIAMTPLLESSAASGEFLQNSNQNMSMLCSTPQHQINLFFTTVVANPGDINIPKLPKLIDHTSLGSDNAFDNVQWLALTPADDLQRSTFSTSSQLNTQVVAPGDVDYPKPPK